MVDEELQQAAHAALRAGKFDQAFKDYTQLAQSGSAHAWVNLGWMHENGAGVPSNLVEAERCYRKAVALNYPSGSFYLARVLMEKKDYKGAFASFCVAADAGHLQSLYWLGRLYITGRGVDTDAKKAEFYLKQAAAQGHLYARRDYNLGLVRGTFGKRQRLLGYTGWLLTILAFIREMIRNPKSKLLH